MIPQVLQQNPPRNIQYRDELFGKNRKRSKSIMLWSVFLIPAVGLLFWLKFDDFTAGLIWGAFVTLIGELIGFALMLNAKKAVFLCQNGIVTLGTVQKSTISGNTGKYTTADSAGYIFIDIVYKENLGRELKGKVTFIGSKKEIDLKEGDQVPVLYLNEKPETFILYSETLGISNIGKAKSV
jgi:hypothetical protein